MTINPYRLSPAEDQYFVGREELISTFTDRLSQGTEAYKVGKGWIILAPGGLGKTSLLKKLMKIAKDDLKISAIFIDIGEYYDRIDLEGLFQNFENQISSVNNFGTVVRKAIGIEPSASTGKLIYRTAEELLKITGLSLSFGPLTIAPVLPSSNREKSTDHAIRIASLFVSLREVSKRQKKPIVVLIDQLSRVHASVQWSKIVHLLLGGIYKHRHDGENNIFYVIASRAEQLSSLEYNIQQPELFESFVFCKKYLNPFTSDEARMAISKRGKGHISYSLVNNIVIEISRNNKVDPYMAMQAAAAIWTHMYFGEKQLSASEIKTEDIRSIITKYYVELVEHYKKFAVRWAILKLLIDYPSGLYISEIVEKLPGLTYVDTQNTMQDLLDQQCYQIIIEVTHGNDMPRYAIAHELLIEALIKYIPNDERLIEQANKTITYGIWKYLNLSELLTREEEQRLWNFRNKIVIDANGWELITLSILKTWEESSIRWVKAFPINIAEAIHAIVTKFTDISILIRCYSILGILQLDSGYAYKSIELIAWNGKNKEIKIAAITAMLESKSDLVSNSLTTIVDSKECIEVRLEAIKGLIIIGKYTNILNELVKIITSKELESIREEAVNLLTTIETPPIPTLIEVAKKTDYDMRFKVTKKLLDLGEKQVAKEFLIKLTNQDLSDYVEAASLLIKLGDVQIGMSALSKMAKNHGSSSTRINAIRSLCKFKDNPISQETLSYLARKEEDAGAFEYAFGYDPIIIQNHAIFGLIELGINSLPTLKELVNENDDKELNINALRGIYELGGLDAALEALADMIKSKKKWIKHVEFYDELKFSTAVKEFKASGNSIILMDLLNNLIQNNVKNNVSFDEESGDLNPIKVNNSEKENIEIEKELDLLGFALEFPFSKGAKQLIKILIHHL